MIRSLFFGLVDGRYRLVDRRLLGIMFEHYDRGNTVANVTLRSLPNYSLRRVKFKPPTRSLLRVRVAIAGQQFITCINL